MTVGYIEGSDRLKAAGGNRGGEGGEVGERGEMIRWTETARGTERREGGREVS